MTQESSKTKNKKQKPKLLEFVQDYIPVKSIHHGLIETTDGRYIKILEIAPINFMLRSDEEQYNIICSFASWLKISPVKLQFKSVTRRADSNKHIAQLKKELEEEDNESCKEVAEDYIRLVQDVGSREALTRRFFLIYQYEPLRRTDSDDFGDIWQIMHTVEMTAKNYFAQCGNEIISFGDPDSEQADILYTFFNRQSCIDEPLESRMERVISDAITATGRILTESEVNKKIRFNNYIGPRGLDFTHRDCVVMDGLYYTYMYIKSDGYPAKARAGWVSTFVNAGEGIDVDVFLNREDRGKTVDKVAQRIRLNRTKIKNLQDTSTDYEEVASSIQAGYYIKNGIANNNEDLFYMSIIITVSAKTYDDLIWRKTQLVNMLKAIDVYVSDCKFQQEEAFKSVMPLIQLSPLIEKKAKRNVLTSGAASTYMFTSYEMSDDTGVLFGLNRHNASLCIVDLFDTKKNKNANLNILGTSGAGKTFTMQLLALRMRMKGIQCFIVAPIKGHEFKRACTRIGGTYIKIAPGSPNCINIMEIRKTTTPEMELIDEVDYSEQDSMLARKIQQLLIFFTLLIPDMSNEEEQLLDEALIETYSRFGITHDNDSVFVDEAHTVTKTMPILGDLHKILSDRPETKRIATIISRFVTGSAQSFNQQTNVDLDNKYVVLDLSELKGRLLPVGMMIALDYVWDIVKADRTKKKAIMIDEIWQLIGASSNKQAAEFCLTIFKTIRGFGGAAISATQDLSDFFGLEDGKYGKAIINNSKNKIILNLEPDEAKSVQEVLKLTPHEVQSITHFERGEALICSNNNKVPIVVKASKSESDMITTDRAELERILREKQEQQNN